uniref:Innexin n=1 Tax=Steinernema glaseri TaxID=37863 RepID=A0A1I7YPY7_9BILA
MVLTTVLSMLRYVGESEDKDFVDRLHSYFTANILIGLAVLVSFKQFGGKPIECLVPDLFTSSWEQYAENYCWAQDTYYVPMAHTVADLDSSERRRKKISYYQWVPFFLLLEAACFRLPCILWKYLSGHSGIKINEILKLASDPNNIKKDIKQSNIHALTVHLKGALRFHRRIHKKQIKPHQILRFFNLPYSAFFVTATYLLIKTVYLLNVALQLFVLNKFLETDKYSWYGFGALLDLLQGKTWETSGIFPRVTLCDFDVRVMGNVQEHTIQCVLTINIFNEKIFVFLWFWYMSLFVVTFFSLLYWLFVTVLPFPNRRFINRHLEMSEMPFDPSNPENAEQVDRFIGTFLKSDGVFVIRMLTMHTGVIFGTDLVLSLFRSVFHTDADDFRLKRSASVTELPIQIIRESEKNQFAQATVENAVNATALRLRRGEIKPDAISKAETERLVPPPPPAKPHLKGTLSSFGPPVKTNTLNEYSAIGPKKVEAPTVPRAPY